MCEIALPASPNWYCSHVMDANTEGMFVFGARRDVMVFDVTCYPAKSHGVFRAHRDKVSALALSPHQRENTNLCCSGSEDGKLKIWKTESKEQLFEHANHRGKLTAVSWSPLQTDLVVSGDDKGDIVSWQHQEGRLQMFSPEHAAVMSLSCSPACASHVAVGYKAGLILIIDIKKDGEIIQRLRGHDEDIQCLGWCPIPGENFKAPKPAYQDLDNPNATVVPAEDDKHASDPDTADFGENGHLIASGSKDKTIRIWSTTRGRQLMYLKVGKSGGREQGNEYGGAKMWTTFVWLKNNPRQIVSSSAGGDLLRWDITTPDQQKSRPFCAEQRRGGHYRMVFNVCLAGREDKLLCSMSMDRQVIVWNSDSGSMFGTLPTLGGFVYVAKTSPVDPGRLAFGVGDSMIRLWNLNNTNNLTDVRNLWQGVKGKVTALSWHPVKEGLLAYGTDDGRVGVYDTLSNRTPSISSTYHKRTVYVVAWGPACTGQGESRDLMVYSIGDGIILGHDMSNLYEEASDINSLIEQTNGKKVKLPTRSEISWSPDMAFVAIGNDDGSVEIFKPPDLQLIVTIHIHKKLINCVQWHPHITMATPGGSPYKYWIATASNEAGVYVVDLSSILDKEIDVAADPLLVAESRQCLLGHVDRVTGVAWSPHNDQQLATVSYDGQALVWDVDKNEMLACYQGHNGRLLCVVWNGLEDDLVLTGADDFSLHQWRLSLHPPDLVNAGRQRKQKYKKKPKKDPTVSVPEQTDSTPPGQADVTLTTEDQESLEKILEEKRHQILLETQLDGKEGIPQGTAVSDDPPTTTDPTCSVTDAHTSTAGPAATVVVATEFTKIRVPSSGTDWEKTKHDLTKDKKKRSWKGKSFFPLSGRAENRGKELLQDDLVYLATKICGPTAEAPSDVPTDSSDPDQEYVHLGFFLDRRGMYKCLKQEGQHHQDHDNMDYYYQLEIWKGNVNGALRLAREREELSDWLVSMAPMANVDTWITVCEDYATQLESEGQYHKAATYLLAAHKVYEAIQIFRRHRLFKEAIALAKVRLSPFDPVLEELYTLWAQQLTRDGNYEQAAKCHLAMKQVQDAALLLARRYNQSSLRTASHICLVAGEKQQGLMYAYKASQQYAVQSDWSDAYRFLKDQKPFQCLSAVTAMHELLMYEIQKISVDNMAVDEEKFTKWEDMGNSKVLLPDFMLDAKENEPISPWQPYLIEGHTFPHHMLRTLHTCLDISMDTANLEDMYKALSVLHAGRQVQTDIQQLLSQVCMDLVLCLLSLLMSETPTAISHLLQAISILHEAAHYDLMELILRLFLPQGPKYLLKLQQEVTAMRVIISMDNNGSVDGASKVHTIKRYLSEIKEDEAISNTSLRCRELDSLRAYYYLVILNFLKKNLCDKVSDVSPKGLVTIDESSALNQASSSDNVKGQSSQGSHSAAAVEQERTENQSDPVTLGSSGDPVTLETSAEPVTLRSSDGPIALGSRGDSMTLGSENGPVTLRTGSDPVTLGSGDNPVTLRPSGDPMASGSGGDPVTLGSGRSSEDNCDRIRNPSENENKVKCDVSEDTSECVIERISQDSSNQTPSIPSPSGKCDTIAQLSREENLSDEKRLPTPQTPTPPGHEASDSAISEENTSPGAINKEATESSVDGKMSESKTNSEIVRERLAGFTFEEPPTYQLTLPLLSHLARGLLWDMQGKRYALTETLGYIHKAISQLLLAQRPSALPGGQTDTIAMGELSVVRDGHFNTHSAGHLDHSSRSLSDTAAGTAHVAAEPHKQDCVAPKVRHHSEPVIERPVPAATGSDVMSCPFHGVISRSAYSRSVSIDSGTADVSLSLQEHLTSLDLDLDASSDCAFGMCSSCELLTKSRRVLWEDQPHPHSHPGPEHQGHHGKAKLTSIVNPAKYINVPDEWYNTAADQKYCMPYVTMAILKDEQEYMMRELKRGPDALQMPFPNPLESVKLLLVVSGKSNFLTVSEKREFAEKMVAWGLQFSVSSQQKETLMESMHRTLTHE